MRNDWDPERYMRFKAQRTRPAMELLSRVACLQPLDIVDLGCGPGNSTALLAQRWPRAKITGIDSSPAMLRTAGESLPTCRFIESDIASWHADSPADLIFANASLQWVPGHDMLLPRLIGQLSENGILAVQMPDNLGEPCHVLMKQVAAEGYWKDRIGDTSVMRPPLLGTGEYYDLLAGAGCHVDMWRTVYTHVMPSADAIAEWLNSTGLRPFLEPLDVNGQKEFLDRYLRELRQAYPPRRDGSVLLPFPRFFFVATRR